MFESTNLLDHGVHIVGEREVVDVKCNDAQIVLIVNKDKASDRFKHKHAHVLSDMFQCVHQGGQSDPAYDLDPAPTHGTHIGVAVRQRHRRSKVFADLYRRRLCPETCLNL